MTDYYKSYTEFYNKNLNIQLQTIKDNIHHYPIIDDLLGFHYWLDSKIGHIYNETENYDINHISEAFIHVTFSHNILSFYTILLTLERNLRHQAMTHMRNILESIPKMCYLSFYPNDIYDIIVKDRISGIRELEEKKNEIEEFKSETQLEILKNLNSDEVIERIQGKYYFKWFVDRVYAEETNKSIRVLYHDLSNSTHSSFVRQQVTYDHEITDKILRDVELLLFYNMIAEIEGHKEMISAGLFPLEESNEFMEKMRMILVRDGKLPSLFPDHPDIIQRVLIHPPGSPWN